MDFFLNLELTKYNCEIDNYYEGHKFYHRPSQNYVNSLMGFIMCKKGGYKFVIQRTTLDSKPWMALGMVDSDDKTIFYKCIFQSNVIRRELLMLQHLN